MNKLKRVLGTAGASAVLALGMAGAAGASEMPRGQAPNINDSYNETTTVDKSVNLNAPCSSYIKSEQGNENNTTQNQTSYTGGNGEVEKDSTSTSTSATSQSNSTNQSNAINVSQDCSTHTTQVAAAAPVKTPASQVVVPAGGVHAGGGGGSADSTSLSALLGMTGSIGALGVGVAMRKKALLGL